MKNLLQPGNSHSNSFYASGTRLAIGWLVKIFYAGRENEIILEPRYNFDSDYANKTFSSIATFLFNGAS